MLVLALALIALPVVIGAYAYVVYPLILRLLPARPWSSTDKGGRRPYVTIVIPAYNEERQIAGAVEAALAQDYPAELRQILVLSDASTDRTDEIVSAYANRGVDLLRMPVRGGKTAAENASSALIRGEIVVNTDSSVRLHPSAVRLLVAAMEDPTVGVASTRDVSVTSAGPDNRSEASYVGYEMALRAMETRTGGIVGASGSGYAIRAALHRKPVREDLSRDFSAALTACRGGYRAVSVNEAVCYVPRTSSLPNEYRRKVRTISRGMETLYFNRDLMELGIHGDFAWKLISHKLARWLVPLAALPALVGLALLATSYWWAAVLLGLALTLGLVTVALVNWPADRPIPSWLPTGPFGAMAANLAVIHSAWRFFHGHDDHIWEPTRRAIVST